MNAEEKLKLLVFPHGVPATVFNVFQDGVVAFYLVYGDLPLDAVNHLIELLRNYTKLNATGRRLPTEEENKFFEGFFARTDVIALLIKHQLLRSNYKQGVK